MALVQISYGKLAESLVRALLPTFPLTPFLVQTVTYSKILLFYNIDRFHSRDQYLDYRCYAAILVYLNGKQTGSVLRVEHGFVHDRWLWQQKWTR